MLKTKDGKEFYNIYVVGNTDYKNINHLSIDLLRMIDNLNAFSMIKHDIIYIPAKNICVRIDQLQNNLNVFCITNKTTDLITHTVCQYGVKDVEFVCENNKSHIKFSLFCERTVLLYDDKIIFNDEYSQHDEHHNHMIEINDPHMINKLYNCLNRSIDHYGRTIIDFKSEYIQWQRYENIVFGKGVKKNTIPLKFVDLLSRLDCFGIIIICDAQFTIHIPSKKMIISKHSGNMFFVSVGNDWIYLRISDLIEQIRMMETNMTIESFVSITIKKHKYVCMDYAGRHSLDIFILNNKSHRIIIDKDSNVKITHNEDEYYFDIADPRCLEFLEEKIPEWEANISERVS